MQRVIVSLSVILISVAAFAALSDPTRPLSGHSPGLNAIYITAGNKVAVFGGKRLVVGDKYNGATIVAINAHSVTLRGNQGIFTISMFQPIVKQTLTKENVNREQDNKVQHN